MFEKNLEVGLLLDFYGDILPETVKKTETELYFYEEKLGLLRRFTEAQTCAGRIRALCEAEKDCVSPALREAIDRLCDAVGAG